MKKTISLILVLILALSFASCKKTPPVQPGAYTFDSQSASEVLELIAPAVENLSAEYYPRYDLTEGNLKTSFGIDSSKCSVKFKSGRLAAPEMSPNTYVVVAVLKVENAEDAKTYAEFLEKNADKAIQVCVGYADCKAVAMGNTVLLCMGTKDNVEKLTAKFNSFVAVDA